MAIPRKKRTTIQKEAVSASGQIEKSHPFSLIDRYIPLSTGQSRLYDALREAVPIIDAALNKINALVGGFSVRCTDPLATRQLEEFLNDLPAGGISTGIDAFLAQYLDQLLMYGTAVGEMILSPSRSTISAVCTAPLDSVEIEKKGAVGADIYVSNGVSRKKIEHPELILLSSISAKPGCVHGTSLLHGLPFVSDILLKIYNTIGVNFERVGNVRFAVTYRPSSDAKGTATAKDRARLIADEWSKAMRSKGSVSDFVAVGDVDIKVIGADNQMLDCEVPARLMLEQIVAKTGLPPFMLGLSWSVSERMSSQQADLLTSELWRYRRILTPVLKKICTTYLRLCGYTCDVQIQWDNISLLDEVELAKAELIRMQAAQIAEKLENPDIIRNNTRNKEEVR